MKRKLQSIPGLSVERVVSKNPKPEFFEFSYYIYYYLVVVQHL